MQDRGADHDIEDLRPEKTAVHVEAEGLDAPAQFGAGLDKRSEHLEKRRRDVGGEDFGARQQPAGGKHAAAAAGADVENAHPALPIDVRQRQAVVDELPEVQSLEIVPMVSFGVFDELRRHACR